MNAYDVVTVLIILSVAVLLGCAIYINLFKGK